MFPIWAHAYSHRMMKSYTSQELEGLSSGRRGIVLRRIRRALNGTIIRFKETGVYYQLGDEEGQLKYDKEEIAYALYNYRKSRKDFSVTFEIGNTKYTYENPQQREITYKRGDEKITKKTWFSEVFPEFEPQPKRPIRKSERGLYGLYNAGIPRGPIDLNKITSLSFKNGSIICEILDGYDTSEIRVFLGNDEIRVTKNTKWLIDFCKFFRKYELEKDRDRYQMKKDFKGYHPKTKKLILQIVEFKPYFDNDGEDEEKRGEEKVDEEEICETETNDLEEDIKKSLQTRKMENALSCIQAEDLGENHDYMMNEDESVQMITTESEGAFIRTSFDRSSAYVSQILDYQTDVVDLEYDKSFARKCFNKYNWVFKDKKTIVSSDTPCSDYIEYKQAEPEGLKDWKFKDPFKPDAHQMHSLKFAGEKILLGHRPGFGKTINSILLAEKMRNSLCMCVDGQICECELPDIYIVAPDRKLVRHWYEEVKRMKDIDIKHYVWSTYKHLEISQAKMDYPEYHHLDPQELIDLKAGKRDRHREYKPARKKERHCMLCDRGYTKSEMESKFPNRDDVGKVYDTVKHILYGGSNDKTTLEFHWRLAEDKIFFCCGECVKRGSDEKLFEPTFITGFTANDDGVKYKNFSEHEKNLGLTTGQYLRREYGVWKTYYSRLKDMAMPNSNDDTKSIQEIKNMLRDKVVQVPQNLKLSYKYKNNMNWHMYRARPCILICDEIHKYVKESKSLILQVLWKYILSCRFTVLASATPVESTGSELTQLYLISEMLRTKRNFWMDGPIRFNMKFNGRFLPPWHLLRPLETGEDMYTVASRMKNKFSRYNTVADIENAITGLMAPNKKTERQIDKKFDLDYTKLMNLYMGTNELKKGSWVMKRESGENSYDIARDGYKRFVDAALSKLYVLQSEKSRGEKEFPDLIPATDTGYIKVPIDLTRGLLKDRPPNSELRYLIPGIDNTLDTFKVEVEGMNSFIVKRDGSWSAEEILELEKYILANRFSEGLMTISFKDINEIEPGAALITNYTNSTGVLPYKEIKERGLKEKIGLLRNKIGETYSGIEGLKWLYLHPVRQQTAAYKHTNMYKNIPYVPNLLSSKVMKIVTTIEEQVAKGKNVMVFHKNVEMLRMCHRALAMRKHLWVNEDIYNARVKKGIDPQDAEAGDYIFNDYLKGLARARAKKRWVKLNREWVKTQNDAYKYFDTLPEPSKYIDYDSFKEAFEFMKKLAEETMYPVVYKNFENNFGKQDIIDTDTLANDLLNFGFYAEYAINGRSVEGVYKSYKKLIDGCEYMKKITEGKVDLKKKTNILDALDIYLHLKDKQKDEWSEIMFDACEPYYKRAIEKTMTQKPETRLIKNPERYYEVKKLKEGFKKTNYKNHKPPVQPAKTRKAGILNYWRTLEEVPEDKKKDIYVIKDGVIQKEFVEKEKFAKKREEEKPSKMIRQPTGRVVYKVKNASLRSAILRKLEDDFPIVDDINKTDEQIDEQYPLELEATAEHWPTEYGTIRKRCIDYYLKMNWKGTNVFTSSFKRSNKRGEPRPFVDYINKQSESIKLTRSLETKKLKEDITKAKTEVKESKESKQKAIAIKKLRVAQQKATITVRFPMPLITLPDHKPFVFEKIQGFIQNTPQIYEHEFFNQDDAREVLDLGDEYKQRIVTFEQITIDNYSLGRKFKRKIENYTDVMTFCLWTQMYLRYEWVQRVNIKKFRVPALDRDGNQTVDEKGEPLYKTVPKAILNPTKGSIETIEEYEEILLHLDSSPYAEKSKDRGKIHVNGNEMEGRKDFLETMKPRITGMSKENRITFAIVDGPTVPADKTNRFVQAFSEGYVDCLFVSESGIVGVDYKSCSPSYMICIDPIVSAGKQDQFNGRTVRRNSHKNLPVEMRKVEYVSFVSTKLEVKKDRTKKDNEEVINYTIGSLSKEIKKEPEGSDRRIRLTLRYRRMKRHEWAKKERKRSLELLEDLKAEVRNEMALKSDGVFVDDAKTKLNNYDVSRIEEILELEKKIRILEASDKLRQKYMPYPGNYPDLAKLPAGVPEISTEDEFVFKLTLEDIKRELIPNNPDEMSETEIRSLLTVQEIRFSNYNGETYNEEDKILNGQWNYEEFTIDPGINQLRQKLGCDKISIENQRNRNWLWKTNSRPTDEQLDPCKSYARDAESVQREPDNKKWNTYFDNYVNLSHVPVYNNYVFLSVEEYHACVKNGKEKYNNYYCYACNKTTPTRSEVCEHCGFKVFDDSGKFLYYHYVESDTKIQDSTVDALKQPTLNTKAQNKSTYRRIQRDRLEMVLSLNSIEHQVKQYGDTTYKFEYDDESTNKKSYYRRIIREPLKEEEGGDWYTFMTKPNIEIYKSLCDRYTEQEPDRFKGTIDESKPAQIKPRVDRTITSEVTDEFLEDTEVLYKNEKWFIKSIGENDTITIERIQGGTQETKVVNKSDLTIVQDPEESKDEDYTPPADEEMEEEYLSDASIQSEY